MTEPNLVEIRVDYHAKLIRVMADSSNFVPDYLKYVFEYLKIKNSQKMQIKFNDVSYKNLMQFKEEHDVRK